MQNLGKKLQLKPGNTLLLPEAPSVVTEALAAGGYTLVNAAAAGVCDAAFLFVHNRQELARLIPEALAGLKAEAMLWIAYPKKTSGITSDLTRDEGWKMLTDLGY